MVFNHSKGSIPDSYRDDLPTSVAELNTIKKH